MRIQELELHLFSRAVTIVTELLQPTLGGLYKIQTTDGMGLGLIGRGQCSVANCPEFGNEDSVQWRTVLNLVMKTVFTGELS